MAITFTDEQLRELSGQIVNSDTTVAAFNGQAEKAQKIKDDYLSNDEQESVYTTEFHSIVDKFHTELKLLNAEQRSIYDLGQIDPAARQISSPHWPSGYVGFIPKLLDSNNGNPKSTFSGDYETLIDPKLVAWIDRITSGFSGTNVIGTGNGFSINTFTTSTAVTIGTNIAVFLNGNGVYGTVSNVTSTTTGTPPATSTTYTVTINVIDRIGTITGSVGFRTGSSGYNEATRTSSSTDGFLLLCKSFIDDFTNRVKSLVQQEKTALSGNGSKPDKSTIDAAVSHCDDTLAVIDSFQSALGQFRFNNSNLTSLRSNVQNRIDTIVPNRIVEIGTSLGSVSQDSEGSTTGDGVYKSLFDSITYRVHKISGTLTNYYRQGTMVKAAQEQAALKTSMTNRDKEIGIVRLLTEAPTDIDSIKLDDISDLLVGDTIKIMDNNETTVRDYNIVSITPPYTLLLDEVVPASYTLEAQVRILKLL